MDKSELLTRISNMGDFPRKDDILQLIESDQLKDVRILVRDLRRHSWQDGPSVAPGVKLRRPSNLTDVYSQIEDMVETLNLSAP